jgi:hypothetical protein
MLLIVDEFPSYHSECSHVIGVWMLGRVNARYVTIPSISLCRYHAVLFRRHYAGILSYSIQAYTILFMSNELCYAFVPAPFPECRYDSTVTYMMPSICSDVSAAIVWLNSLATYNLAYASTAHTAHMNSVSWFCEPSILILLRIVPLIGSWDVCWQGGIPLVTHPLATPLGGIFSRLGEIYRRLTHFGAVKANSESWVCFCMFPSAVR